MSDETNLSLQPQTLREIQKTAVEAAGAKNKVQIIEPSAERGERYLIVEPSGAFEWCEPQPIPRQHTLHALDQVPEFVKYAGREEREGFYEPAVWFNEGGVTIVLNDLPLSHRRERVTLKFEKTPEFELLESWSQDGPPDFSQKDLVKLLRTKLSACETPQSLELLKIVRELAAKTRSESRGSVRHGGESLGRDIESEVVSAIGEVPEETVFRVRVFDDPLLQAEWSVQATIEIDPQMLTIELFPRAEDIRTAMDKTHEQVGEYLRRECGDTPVFYGSP